MWSWVSRILLALLLLTALAFGALNGRFVELDLLLTQLNMPLGVALLSFMVMGVLIGAGALYLFWLFPLKRKLNALQRQSPNP
jgi:uncharacterized integral membrane protein